MFVSSLTLRLRTAGDFLTTHVQETTVWDFVMLRTRNAVDPDAALLQVQRLLAAAAEHIRVATLQPHHLQNADFVNAEE